MANRDTRMLFQSLIRSSMLLIVSFLTAMTGPNAQAEIQLVAAESRASSLNDSSIWLGTPVGGGEVSISRI
jgi:hypothetical protein